MRNLHHRPAELKDANKRDVVGGLLPCVRPFSQRRRRHQNRKAGIDKGKDDISFHVQDALWSNIGFHQYQNSAVVADESPHEHSVFKKYNLKRKFGRKVSFKKTRPIAVSRVHATL